MNHDKISILHLITGLGKGGAERVIFDICKFSDKKKYHMSVIAFGKKDDLLSDFIFSEIDVEFIYIRNKIDMFFSIFKIYLAINKKNPRIIHVHLFHALLFAVLIKVFSFLKARIIFTSHSNIGSKFREFVIFCLKPFRALDIIFSNIQKSYYDKSNALVIQNGIDTSKYKPLQSKNNTFTFINIARLEPVKNQGKLLEIVSNIKTTIPFKLQIVGEGYLMENLQKKIAEMNLENKVELLGYRPDIAQLCCSAHAFVLPSIWEGLPISLIEAGACGLPVICTPVGSISSVINESNGYISSIENFAKNMTFVIENYDLAQKKGAILQADIINNYDVSIMCDKYSNAYFQLLNSKT